jgi:hypothetical protein
VKVAVRKLSSRVRWEGPLAAMQRAEGVLLLHTPGAEDVTGYRISPCTAQQLIAAAARAGVSAGAPARPGVRLVPHLSATDVFALAGREVGPYEAGAAGLAAAVARVAGGGEAWTIEEKLRKLAALQTRALAASHAAEHGQALTEEEAAAVEALEQGRAELARDAERARVGGEGADDGEGDDELRQLEGMLRGLDGAGGGGHGHGHGHHAHGPHAHAV